MKPPKRYSEIIVDELMHDRAQGHYFRVVCDPALHAAIKQMDGVNSIVEFDSGTVWVHIDPRYSAHEVYVYVTHQITDLAKESKLIQEAEAVISAIKD